MSLHSSEADLLKLGHKQACAPALLDRGSAECASKRFGVPGKQTRSCCTAST